MNTETTNLETATTPKDWDSVGTDTPDTKPSKNGQSYAESQGYA